MRVKRWLLTPSTSRPPDSISSFSSYSHPLPRVTTTIQQRRRNTTLTGLKERWEWKGDPYRKIGDLFERSLPISLKFRTTRTRNLVYPNLGQKEIQHEEGQPRTNLVETESEELKRYLSTCQELYQLLSGPLWFHRHSKFRNSTTRIVGHTMRLLMNVGRGDLARELDRAFFTTEAQEELEMDRSGGRTYSGGSEGEEMETRQREGLEGEKEDGKSRKSKRITKLGYGQGLGLKRGGIVIAWMQSLAVRLNEEAVRNGGIEEFAQLLNEMEEQEHPSQLTSIDRRMGSGRSMMTNPLILAFLSRKLEIVHERLARGGTEQKSVRRQVRRMMQRIKDGEGKGQEMVSLALLDGAIERLERQSGKGEDILEGEMFEQVERDIERLVGSLDGPTIDDEIAVVTEVEVEQGNLKAIDRHSHILYLAIRFLLLRFRHLSSIPRSHSPHDEDTASNLLSSASQLYALLLDLTNSTAACESILDLSRLRVRQSSALYRLMWAHLGVDPTHNDLLPSAKPSNRYHRNLPLYSHRIVSAYHLIDITLSSVESIPSLISQPDLPSHLPSDPRLVGVSTKFHREALYLLSLAFAPSRRRFHQRQHRDLVTTASSAPSPPPRSPLLPSWSTFQRMFSTIIRQRLNDSTCLQHARPPHLPPSSSSSTLTSTSKSTLRRRKEVTKKRAKKEEWELDLIVQPSLAIHLLRATLLSPSEESEVGQEHELNGHHDGEREIRRGIEWGRERGDSGAGTPLSRLDELFDLVSTLEERRHVTSPRLDDETDDPNDQDSTKSAVKAKRLLYKAVKVVVEDEWKGPGTKVWKELIKNRVRDWSGLDDSSVRD